MSDDTKMTGTLMGSVGSVQNQLVQVVAVWDRREVLLIGGPGPMSFTPDNAEKLAALILRGVLELLEHDA